MVVILIGVILNILSLLSVAIIYTEPNRRFEGSCENIKDLFKRNFIGFSLGLIIPFLLAFCTILFYMCLLLNLIPNNDDTTS